MFCSSMVVAYVTYGFCAYLQISHNDLEKGTECLDLAWKHGGVKAKLVPAPDVVWKVSMS